MYSKIPREQREKHNEEDIFCENIKILRKKSKLTQKEMAKKLGISIYSIRMLENGKIPNHVTVEILFRIQKHFGIPIKLLFQKTE